jgi:hypothetical protein
VLYRDGLIAVIDKPAEIAVHPGPDLEGRFDELRFSLRHPPALAHRLDRDTSGCLVLGRHPKAPRRLGALFRNGRIEKVYWAVVDGQLPKTEGSIETGLKKLSRGSGWRMIVDPAPKGGHGLLHPRCLRWVRLARIAATHGPDPSAARYLRRARLSRRRRSCLRTWQEKGSADALRSLDHLAAMPGAAADRSHCAGAAPHAGRAAILGL